MAKIKVTAQQRTNAISAKEMWNSVPEKNVSTNLSSWREDRKSRTQPDCNSIACFGGWCAWWPAFQAQGVSVTTGGAPFMKSSSEAYVDQELFGEPGMFNPRRHHTADKNKNLSKWSDWEVVMNRLDWLIKNSVVTT